MWRIAVDCLADRGSSKVAEKSGHEPIAAIQRAI